MPGLTGHTPGKQELQDSLNLIEAEWNTPAMEAAIIAGVADRKSLNASNVQHQQQQQHHVAPPAPGSSPHPAGDPAHSPPRRLLNAAAQSLMIQQHYQTEGVRRTQERQSQQLQSLESVKAQMSLEQYQQALQAVTSQTQQQLDILNSQQQHQLAALSQQVAGLTAGLQQQQQANPTAMVQATAPLNAGAASAASSAMKREVTDDGIHRVVAGSFMSPTIAPRGRPGGGFAYQQKFHAKPQQQWRRPHRTTEHPIAQSGTRKVHNSFNHHSPPLPQHPPFLPRTSNLVVLFSPFLFCFVCSPFRFRIALFCNCFFPTMPSDFDFLRVNAKRERSTKNKKRSLKFDFLQCVIHKKRGELNNALVMVFLQ